MAKSTCLLALFVAVVVCAEAIRIDPPQPPSRTGKHFPSVMKAHPKCKDKENRSYIIDTKTCKKYLKCVNGDGQVRVCPSDFEFDSKRNCIPPSEKPNCGKNETQSGPLDVDEQCPKTYGIFPVKSDSHKYMTCYDGIPTIVQCPDNHVYRDTNGACVEGDKYPDQSSEDYTCKRANQMFPDVKNCRRYIQCVNFLPLRKECPPAKAFDPTKKMCTKEYLEKCKNNDIRNIGQDE